MILDAEHIIQVVPNIHNTGCPNFNVSKIVMIFSQGRQLEALISHAFFGKILKFLCTQDWKFPEFFKNRPTSYSNSTQGPSVTISL